MDFVVCTAGGIVTVHIMNLFLKDKINPLDRLGRGVGRAHVRPGFPQHGHPGGSQQLAPTMHAMGPNLAGVIGTAAAAGMFIAMFQ